ncbi:hypothetical protein [Patulibacter sp.]|uniref:hypothetical protein n=1 Tax=Patulibacter sp. TaxID=1912859 RepID=UPI002724DB3C|nr:hypothetical protein [Patulibacter sp.]MDO9406770.1 hypothetical protein [Patulibacter sp.]
MSFTWRDPSIPGTRPGPSASAWKAHATATIVHATLEALLDTAPAVSDPLAAELLGSDACGVWWAPADEADVAPAEHEHLVGRTYAAHLEQLATPAAVAALRALQLGGSDGVVPEVEAAAERLVESGLPEPPWWPDAGRIAALRGARLSWDDDGHRYTSLLLEVDRAGDVVTMAVATLDDCAGVIGDVLLFSDLDGFGAVVDDPADDRRLEWLDVPAVQGLIRRAIDRTDLLGTGDPPGTSEPEVGYVALRGLAQRWSHAPGA